MTAPAINLARMLACGGLWAAQAVALAQDATSALKLTARLQPPAPGAYGRYVAGRTTGPFTSVQADAYQGQTALAGLVAAAVAQRAIVAAAATAVADVADIATGLAPAAGALVTALAGCAVDPADGVRLLAGLAAFAPSGPDAASEAGQRVSDLFRRLAIASLAVAVSQYQPASADDAATVRDLVTAAIDAVADAAGDLGDDASYIALRSLRAALVADLGRRGAALPSSTTVTVQASLPALALAQQLFGDPSRAADLVSQADPVSPLFMPASFVIAGAGVQ